MPISFTDREVDVMAVLWERGSGTVAEVRDALSDDYARTTVPTVLRTLEEKGCRRTCRSYVQRYQRTRSIGLQRPIRGGRRRSRTMGRLAYPGVAALLEAEAAAGDVERCRRDRKAFYALVPPERISVAEELREPLERACTADRQ